VKGRRLSLPPGRRIVADMAQLSIGSPRAILLGRINVREVRDARMRAMPRVAWPALFMKAYAIAAREMPELRRIYVKLPWPHIYELPSSVAALVVEREIAGEAWLLLARFRNPSDTSLAALDAGIRTAKHGDIGANRAFVEAVRLARVPMPLRRILLSRCRVCLEPSPSRCSAARGQRSWTPLRCGHVFSVTARLRQMERWRS
jgi:hypothetical protein